MKPKQNRKRPGILMQALTETVRLLAIMAAAFTACVATAALMSWFLWELMGPACAGIAIPTGTVAAILTWNRLGGNLP